VAKEQQLLVCASYHSPLTGLVAGKICIESLVVNHVPKEQGLLACRFIIRRWPGQARSAEKAYCHSCGN
jgi:hypothetical protein